MNIVMVGTGYVGLVSGALFAHLGHNVLCIDKNAQKVAALKNGVIPIYEPDLAEYVTKSLTNGKLRFGAWDEVGATYDAIFIAVGTPPLESGEADLSQIYSATLEAASMCKDSTVIVIKSTVPPSTCKELQRLLESEGFNHQVASNPEFLREGNAIYDFLHPDRIVFGANASSAFDVLLALYKPLVDNGCKVVQTDTTTSEMIKYASNTFLATKIAFINEMANLCEDLGADIDALSLGVGMDHRIGADFLKSGPGFGGSCFPKDILALSYLAHKHSEPCYVLDAVILSNQKRRKYIVDKIERILGGDIATKKLCVYGLTFKAGTDDVRSSPAIDIVDLLITMGVNVVAYDPEGMENAKMLLPEEIMAASPYDAAIDADAVVILTEWPEFAALDFQKIGNSMRSKVIFDYRNILDCKYLQSLGFEYHRIGRRTDKTL